MRAHQKLGALLIGVGMIGTLIDSVRADENQPQAPTVQSAEPGGEKRIVSRVIYLYYFRDANRLAELVNQSARVPDDERVDFLREELRDVGQRIEDTVVQRRQAEREIKLAAGAREAESDVDLITVVDSVASASPPEKLPLDPRTRSLVIDRQGLLDRENLLYQRQFSLRSDLESAEKNAFVTGDDEATDPVANVSISVVGEGRIHLRGPLKGVNRIVRIIHQIDKPVGQVKVRLHSIQINGDGGRVMDEVHGYIDSHMTHARALTQQAAMLFPRAVSKIYSEMMQQGDNPHEGASPFLCKQFCSAYSKLGAMTENDSLTDVEGESPAGRFGPLSLESIDMSTLLGSLYMAALAEDEVRNQIFEEFRNSVTTSLAEDEVRYFNEMKRRDDPIMRSLLEARYDRPISRLTEADVREWTAQAFPFANLQRLLLSQVTGPDALNSVQSSTIQLAKGLRTLSLLEKELRNLMLERSLFERTAGEVEARAIEARREMIRAKQQLETLKREAEDSVTLALQTVLAGLQKLAADDPSHTKAQKEDLAKFRAHLVRLQDPGVQAQLAPIIMDALTRIETESRSTVIDNAALSERLYGEVRDFLSDSLKIEKNESDAVGNVAKTQIAALGDRLRLVTRAFLSAQRKVETAEDYYQQALRTNEYCYRRVFAKRVLDQFIEEQEEKVAAVWEAIRPRAASIDSYLKQMAIAFEDDVNSQFYKPAFDDVRRAARDWEVALGQLETTTVLTNDRTPARVSPAQTVEFDLPERKLLLEEARDGFNLLAAGTGKVLQAVGLQSTAGPAGAAVVSAVSNQLDGPAARDLIPRPRLYGFEAGNDFEITPVIQPDAYSIAYKFDYVYTTNVSEPTGPEEKRLPRVKRHFVKTEVQTSSYELREISRFRVALNAADRRRGVPLLEKLPRVGKLFRPKPSTASSLQENILLADCVVYPTVFDLTGRRWLESAKTFDTKPLLADDQQEQDRQAQLRSRLLSITRQEVEKLIETPTADPPPPSLTLPAEYLKQTAAPYSPKWQIPKAYNIKAP